MISRLNPIFIDTIPDELEDGVLYISIKFRVIMHSCCCGCKSKVVTPLSPVRWKMTFNGKDISLSPSIGNWNSDCQSHYWIENSEVICADKWTEDEVIDGKSSERRNRADYYKEVDNAGKEKNKSKAKSKKGILKVIKEAIKKKK